MSGMALEARGRWTAAVGGSVIVVAVFLLLFRLAHVLPPTMPATMNPAPVVELTRTTATHDRLREETMMSDPKPLFLPTEHNATLPEMPLRAPGRTLLDSDPARLSFIEAAPEFAQQLPPVTTLNSKPLAAATPVDAIVAEATIPLALGFGRKEPVIAPLAPRGGFMDVVALSTAEKVLGHPLPIDARPPTEQLWQPVEFSLLVDAAGLVGPPEITSSSRVEAVDAHFKNYLVQRLRLGDRLAPGVYRVTIGP